MLDKIGKDHWIKFIIQSFRKTNKTIAKEFAEKIITSDEYDIVILDEIGVAVEYGVIDVEDVLKLIDKKPEKVELIITGGPKIHPKIKERADLLTEMRMIKHYYASKGINARFGIEY